VLTATLRDGEQAFDELEPLWNELVARSMTNTPFQRLEYQRAWWRHLRPSGARLLTIAVSHATEGPIAIGCFYLKDRKLFFNGAREESDYLDIIVPARHAVPAWAEMLRALDDAWGQAWDELQLGDVPSWSLTRSVSFTPDVMTNLTASTVPIEACQAFSLPSTFESYLDRLPARAKHEIRRKLRRARAAGAGLEVITECAPARAAIGEFLDLLASSTSKRIWLDEPRRRFFAELAAVTAREGRLALLFLTVNGRRVAALFCFQHGNRVWVYNSGMDQAFFHLSPGEVLIALAIARSIECGLETFDFMRGHEQYKRKFGTSVDHVWQIRMTRSAHANLAPTAAATASNLPHE